MSSSLELLLRDCILRGSCRKRQSSDELLEPFNTLFPLAKRTRCDTGADLFSFSFRGDDPQSSVVRQPEVAMKVEEEVQEIVNSKEVGHLLRDNEILKRAVVIQHKRCLEFEEKLNETQHRMEEKQKELLHWKCMVTQYQERVKVLEMSNYSLKVRLQIARGSCSVPPSGFQPEVF